VTKKQENQTILPPTAEETDIPADLHEADTKPVDIAPTDSNAAPLDPKEEARRRSREDLERKRRTNHRGGKR
jgi:hypothetical protein